MGILISLPHMPTIITRIVFPKYIHTNVRRMHQNLHKKTINENMEDATLFILTSQAR